MGRCSTWFSAAPALLCAIAACGPSELADAPVSVARELDWGGGGALHVDDTTVYATIHRDYGYALHALTPELEEVWASREERTSFSQSLTRAPEGGVVWGVTAQGHNWGDSYLSAYAADGTLRWEVTDPVSDRLGGPLYGVVARGNHLGVVVLGGLGMMALDSGQVRWSDPETAAWERRSVAAMDIGRRGLVYAVGDDLVGEGFALVQYDSEGRQRWNIPFRRDEAHAREPYPADVVAVDGGCVVASSVYVPFHGGGMESRGVWLERYDETGRSAWRSEVIAEEAVRGFSVEPDADGFIAWANVCHGCERPPDVSSYEIRVARVAGDGTVEWRLSRDHARVTQRQFAVGSHGIYFVATTEDGPRLVSLR